MEFRVKSTDPKSHLLICSAINFFGPHIMDSKIPAEEEGVYGFFILDGSPDLIESLYHLPGITLEIQRDFPKGGDI